MTTVDFGLLDLVGEQNISQLEDAEIILREDASMLDFQDILNEGQSGDILNHSLTQSGIIESKKDINMDLVMVS